MLDHRITIMIHPYCAAHPRFAMESSRDSRENPCTFGIRHKKAPWRLTARGLLQFVNARYFGGSPEYSPLPRFRCVNRTHAMRSRTALLSARVVRATWRNRRLRARSERDSRWRSRGRRSTSGSASTHSGGPPGGWSTHSRQTQTRWSPCAHVSAGAWPSRNGRSHTKHIPAATVRSFDDKTWGMWSRVSPITNHHLCLFPECAGPALTCARGRLGFSSA